MSATATVAADPHADCDEHPCLPCKLRYWRTNGMQVSIPDGWRGPSVYARAERQYNEAKAAGYDPVPAADKYRWV